MSDDQTAQSEFDETIKLLWRAPAFKKRGPKPAHSLGDVLDAAIRVADSEGLERVSMQRLALELGFTKMAVYRYLPGRAELIALMTDRAIGSPPETFRGSSWRDRIDAWAQAVFLVFVAHPWGIEATTGRRVPGPHEIAWVEAGLAILVETGLDGASRLDVLAVITGHLRFIAVQASGRGATIGLETEMNTLMNYALVGHEMAFPLFQAAIREAATTKAEQGALSFGLSCILDGVERKLENLRQ
jgi:AcrR family transcriptional regulator